MKDKLNLNYPYNTFYPGLLRWSRDGEIDLDTEKGVARAIALLKVICNSPAFDFYDGDFNGLSFESVKSSVNIDLDADEYHSDGPHRYRIERIASFVQARKYRKYAPEWCILESEVAYDGHSDYGKNRIDFYIRDDMEKIPAFPGKDFPHDDYGLSLIAVITEPDSEIVSVTPRWNCEDEKLLDFLKNIKDTIRITTDKQKIESDYFTNVAQTRGLINLDMDDFHRLSDNHNLAMEVVVDSAGTLSDQIEIALEAIRKQGIANITAVILSISYKPSFPLIASELKDSSTLFDRNLTVRMLRGIQTSNNIVNNRSVSLFVFVGK